MVQVHRAEVAIDRAVVDHQKNEEKVAGRLWAILGACESCVKVVAAVVAAVIQSMLEIISSDWGRDGEIYRDVARKQGTSRWRCLVGIYSPSQALKPLLDEAAKKGGYAEDYVTVQHPKKPLPWGTEYDPNTTPLLEKLRFCGPIHRSTTDSVKQS